MSVATLQLSSLVAIALRVVFLLTGTITMTTSLGQAIDVANGDSTDTSSEYSRRSNLSTLPMFPASSAAAVAGNLDDRQFYSTSGLNRSTTDNENATAVDSGGSPYSTWQVALIATVCGVIVVGTIVGNVLVCTAVAIVRRLRTPSNLLIVSLAVSDLLVAVLDMPFALAYEVMGTWVLGKTICDAWTSLDVLLCTSSILNLCAISIDRYFVITRPFQYAMKRSPARMAVMIAIVWSLSALISIPPLMGWKSAEPTRDGECMVSPEFGYQVYATIGAFYLPLTVMIIIYVRIFLVSSRIARAEALSKPSFDAGCLSSQPSMPSIGSSSNRLLQPASQRCSTQQQPQQHHSRISLSTTGSQTPAERKDSVATRRHSPDDLLRVQSPIVEWDKLASPFPTDANCSTSSRRRPSTTKMDNSPVELVVDVSTVVQFVSGSDNNEQLQHDDDDDDDASPVDGGHQSVHGDVAEFRRHGEDVGKGSNGFVTRSCSQTDNGHHARTSLQLPPSHTAASSSSQRIRTFSFVSLLPVRRSTLPATADHQRFRPFVKSMSSSAPSRNSSGTSKSSAPSRRVVRASMSNERKATKTLGVIMGAFTACWLPFFILALLRPLICDNGQSPDYCPIPSWLNALLLWLGYANSLLNPIIYARFNREFRTPFRHILQCHIRDINVRLRSDNYTEQYGGGGVGTSAAARSNSVAACSDWLLQRPRGSTTSADALVRCSVQHSARCQQLSDPI